MREIARSSFLCGSAATAILLQQNVAQAQAMPEQRGHQNLLLDAAGAAGLRTRLKTDPFAAGLYRTLHAYSERILTQDFVAFDTATEKIHESLGQVYALGLLWRIDGEPRYAERARRILRSMAEHPDWHPADFLNVAETTHAMAIGYDWLYPILTVEERKLYVDAIVRKGLDVALALHSQQNEGGWWYKANHNWNIVCNSGIGMGALAVLPESPGKAMRCIHNSLASLPHALASYAPDGGWLEGPTYWTYATNYVMTYIAGLQSIFRHDFGLSTSPGLAETGLFRICFSGPCGDFNYSDANAQLFPAPVMFWAATKFNRPAYAWHEHSLLENPGFPHEPQHLLWLPENLEVHPPDDLPLVKEFTSCDVGFLRSAWFDPMALFVGAKGGNNQANHAHLDLGSFIFDAGGVRWAMDFGSDRYSLPGYFKDRRYTYYRTRTEAHNTVLFDNENQDLHGRASMKRSNDSLEIHLAAAHSRKLKAWIRRLQLVASHSLIIEDNIEALYPVEALWGMITPADIALHGKHAILKKNGKTLTAQIESPEDARFDIVSTRQPKPQNPNAGTAKLVVRLAANITAVKIRVRLTLA